MRHPIRASTLTGQINLQKLKNIYHIYHTSITPETPMNKEKVVDVIDERRKADFRCISRSFLHQNFAF